MKTSLTDLNEYLFAELDRLSNDDLKGDELTAEIHRAKALNAVSKTVVDNAGVMLQAVRLNAEYGRGNNLVPNLLENDKKNANE